jgi:hypothetical protein
MPISPKVNGTFKGANGLFAKVNGGWKKAQFGYVKVEGQWKQFWAGSLEDTFDRADTTNTLGTSQSGQAWTIVRSQWRINSNNANTTGAKTDYPLALIDLGITEIDAEMNGMSPGTGLALRATNANNWLAIYPYYREESFTYSFCAQSGTESYCIAACPNPSYYNSACLFPNTESTITEYFEDCYAPGCNAYDTGGYWECEDCNCTDGGTQFVCPDPVCFQYEIGGLTYEFCDDPDYYECEWQTTDPQCECCPYYVEGELACNPTQDPNCFTPVTTSDCLPGGYSLVPVYDCCQVGQREVCLQTGTATGYNYYYNIRVAQMVNGVFSVVQDIPVNRRWNALKVTASGVTLAINVYGDAAYTDLVGSANVTNGIAGTAYGVMAAPSLYEDGRNIGAMKVKAIGQ